MIIARGGSEWLQDNLLETLSSQEALERAWEVSPRTARQVGTVTMSHGTVSTYFVRYLRIGGPITAVSLTGMRVRHRLAISVIVCEELLTVCSFGTESRPCGSIR